MYEGGQLVTLNIESVLPNRFQPRIHFDEQKLNELAESIRKYGVIQPIVVRQIGTKFEIIAGERRFKASKIANRTNIPAIIVNLSDKDSEEIALLENIQRQELTAIEEAVSYKRILDMGYVTQEALAKKLGKSQSTIANKIRLLNLDDHVQDALLHGKISERHARSMLKLPNNDAQIHMLNRIITERLTVKRTDEEVAKLLSSLPEGEQKTIMQAPPVPSASEHIESLYVEPKPETVPKASHEIGRGNPSPGVMLNKPAETIYKPNKEERGQGFMDIDKIRNEAKDINLQPEVNDISDLMKKDETTVMPEPQVVPAPVPETNTEVNKFVNFAGAMQEEEPTPVQAPQPSNSVSFDSIFNQQPVGLNPQPASHPASAQAEGRPFYAEAQQATPVESRPLPQTTPPTSEPMMQPLQPETISEPSVTQPYQAPKPEVIRESPNVPVQPYQTPQPEVIIETPIAPEQPYQAPRPPQPVITNVPDADIIEETIMPMSEPTVQPSLVTQSPVSAPMPSAPAHNFRQVINLIRNCATQIEELGYYIDLDEFDLGDTYQVTFKIDKE